MAMAKEEKRCPRCRGLMETRVVTDTAGAADTIQVFFLDFCPACEEKDRNAREKKGGKEDE